MMWDDIREQEMTSTGKTGRQHEAGRQDEVPLLLLAVRDASRRSGPRIRDGDNQARGTH